MRIALLSMVLLMTACKPNGPSPEQLAKEKAEKLQHTSEVQQWRMQRIEKLKQPDGWLSLVGMHWLPQGISRVGSGPANGTRINVGPKNLGLITTNKKNQIWLQPDSIADLTIDGKPASGRVELIPDSRGKPTVVGFNNGHASFIVIERGGRLALRVRDADAPTRLQFTGIDSFPIDRKFRVTADFKAHEAGRTIDVVNILGMVEPMMNPGTVTFKLGGQSFTLEAIDEGDHRLFLVFADRTSGKETYAAARFLYAEYPDAEGKTIVDFNKTYNPPCSFTPFSTCPMPPPENRMDFAITAGEKKPRKITP
jgi:uncharacterized protein (DUF1684 family)